jgi:magnesium chelatase family protein
LLDRFDIRLEIYNDTGGCGARGESSADTAARVLGAVERQRARLRGTPWRRNAHVPAGALECFVALTDDARAAWHAWTETRMLTGRGAARVRRVARTIADLDDRAEISVPDIDRAVFVREDLW